MMIHTTDQYQLATQLNSQGATLLENGQYEEAQFAFTKALKIFQQMMNERHNNDVVDQHYQPAKQATSSLDQCMKQILLPVERPTADIPSSDGEYFIYDSPLGINACPPNGTWQDISTTDSAIVIFNLALSLHLGSVKSNGTQQLSSPSETLDEQSKQLEMAKSLYELAYRLQGQIDETQCNFRFIFAVTNNLGHVLKSLQKPQRAIQCYEHLLSMLMYVVDCSAGGGGGTPSSEVISAGGAEMDGYFRNTSRLVLADSAAAAA
jgi:tetratricopeptide (TPR) repeat protein